MLDNIRVIKHEEIDQRLDRIDNLIEPEGEMDPEKDHFIGVMSDRLKKFFTLWRSVAVDFSKSEEECCKIVRAIFNADEGDRKDLEARVMPAEAEFNLLRQEERALREMFWLSVKREFPSAKGKSAIRVCKGFKIIWREREEKKSSGLDVIIL